MCRRESFAHLNKRLGFRPPRYATPARASTNASRRPGCLWPQGNTGASGISPGAGGSGGTHAGAARAGRCAHAFAS
jgi:hypothetical protein